ncbi:MAG: hypothetical protein JST62_11425 [Bacteroidetes bacterium]|nr:hypothetical protein [Bacteroidota bacterium]
MNKRQVTIAIIFLSVLFKISFLKYPFFGLEYEDSYIYTGVSKYLQYNYEWAIDPFQTKMCSDGKLSDCYSYATYNGHSVFLPLLVSFLNRLVGFSVKNIFIINFIASVVSIVFFMKILFYLKSNSVTVFFTALVMTATPFLNLFNTSGLAETLSGCFIIMSLYYYFKAHGNGFNVYEKYFWLFIVLFILSIVVKRENLVLVIIPITNLIWMIWHKHKANRFRLSFLMIVVVLLAVLYVNIAGIISMEIKEGRDIGTNTFAIQNLELILPKLAISFVKFKYFGITGILLVSSVIWAVLFSTKLEYKVFGVTALSYMLMYSLHYRSFDQVHFGAIGYFDTLRYTTNYFPIGCLCISQLDVPVLRHFRCSMPILVLLFVGFMLIENLCLRKEYSNVEFKQRILPVVVSLKSTTDKDYILTDVPILFYIYSANRHIVDIKLTSINRIDFLMGSDRNGRLFYLRNVTGRRFNIDTLIFDHYTVIKLDSISSNFKLFTLSPKED